MNRNSTMAMAALIGVFLTYSEGFGQCPCPPVEDDSGTCHTEVVVFGATLGRNWLGFDSNRTNDYSTGLDVTLPLYVTWIYTDDESLKCQLCLLYGPHDPQSQNLFRIDPPQGLSVFVPWFKDADGTTHEDKFFVTAAAFGDDLDPSTEDFSFDPNYIPCPGPPGSGLPPKGLEEPRRPATGVPGEGNRGVITFDSSAQLRVKDIHGGRTAKATIHLERRLIERVGCLEPRYKVVVGIGWAQPKVWQDFHGPAVLRRPGDVFGDFTRTFLGGTLSREVFYDRRIVHWTTGDFPPTSPGFVDAGDFARLATRLGWGVKWSAADACIAPCNDPMRCTDEFFFDVAPLGASPQCVDSADLSLFATMLGTFCGLTSKMDGFTKEDILAWFGMTYSGRTIAYNGGDLPEVVVVDPGQTERAIADPYGYTSNPIPHYPAAEAAARPVSWGQVKRLYRD